MTVRWGMLSTAALDRLTREGLIDTAGQETVNGRQRQYYTLTPTGHTALHTEAAHMAAAARLITTRPQARLA